MEVKLTSLYYVIAFTLYEIESVSRGTGIRERDFTLLFTVGYSMLVRLTVVGSFPSSKGNTHARNRHLSRCHFSCSLIFSQEHKGKSDQRDR